MAQHTIRRQSVTLEPDAADWIARQLIAYAHQQRDHGRRTRNAAIAVQCAHNAEKAQAYAELITRALYTEDLTHG